MPLLRPMRSRVRPRGRSRLRDAAARGAALVALAAVVGGSAAFSRPPAAAAAPREAAAPETSWFAQPPDTLAGRSGKLRARFLVPTPAAGLFTYLRRLFGDTVGARPGVYAAPAGEAPAGEAARPFTYIAMRPFGHKVNGRIGGYRIGFWPGELGRAVRGPRWGDPNHGNPKYGTPAGFIEVTPGNAETAVSEHFRLRDFLTHDQARVWPKYLVLDEALVDKLELVISDLRARGYRADRLHVMSGLRTPQYNRRGGDTRGRAELSRHQYGDAADVWVENGDGTMADLTGDGRVDAADAAVLAESAERVERLHPELTGGVGVYRGTRAHGPFVHIDTRGHRARWGAG